MCEVQERKFLHMHKQQKEVEEKYGSVAELERGSHYIGC